MSPEERPRILRLASPPPQLWDLVHADWARCEFKESSATWVVESLSWWKGRHGFPMGRWYLGLCEAEFCFW